MKSIIHEYQNKYSMMNKDLTALKSLEIRINLLETALKTSQ